MGRQWLHAKRAIVNERKSKISGKLTKEISVAAKLGGGDPAANARLFAAVEKAKKASVTRDVIERAIKKGAGVGDDKLVLEHITFEGYAPHKVPVIVEVYTDNHQRTAPEMRVLFKQGVLGQAGSNKFLFDHVGLVEAHHPDTASDLEAAAIEAGANDFEPVSHEKNDDIPEGHAGARFVTDIKAKTRLLLLSIGAVAKKAAVGKNWSDVAPVKDRRSLDRRLRYQRNERQGRTRELRKLEIRKRAASYGYRDACKDEWGSRNGHASKCNGGSDLNQPLTLVSGQNSRSFAI